MPVLSCGGHGGRLPCQGSRPPILPRRAPLPHRAPSLRHPLPPHAPPCRTSCRTAPPCRTPCRTLCRTPCRTPCRTLCRTLSPSPHAKRPHPPAFREKKRPPAACRRAPAHPGGRRPIPAGEVPPSRCLRAIHAPHTVVGPNHKKKRRRRRPQFPPVFPGLREGGGGIAAAALRRLASFCAGWFFTVQPWPFPPAGQSRRGR